MQDMLEKSQIDQRTTDHSFPYDISIKGGKINYHSDQSMDCDEIDVRDQTIVNDVDENKNLLQQKSSLPHPDQCQFDRQKDDPLQSQSDAIMIAGPKASTFELPENVSEDFDSLSTSSSSSLSSKAAKRPSSFKQQNENNHIHPQNPPDCTYLEKESGQLNKAIKSKRAEKPRSKSSLFLSDRQVPRPVVKPRHSFSNLSVNTSILTTQAATTEATTTSSITNSANNNLSCHITTKNQSSNDRLGSDSTISKIQTVHSTTHPISLSFKSGATSMLVNPSNILTSSSSPPLSTVVETVASNFDINPTTNPGSSTDSSLKILDATSRELYTTATIDVSMATLPSTPRSSITSPSSRTAQRLELKLNDQSLPSPLLSSLSSPSKRLQSRNEIVLITNSPPPFVNIQTTVPSIFSAEDSKSSSSLQNNRDSSHAPYMNTKNTFYVSSKTSNSSGKSVSNTKHISNITCSINHSTINNDQKQEHQSQQQKMLPNTYTRHSNTTTPDLMTECVDFGQQEAMASMGVAATATTNTAANPFRSAPIMPPCLQRAVLCARLFLEHNLVFTIAIGAWFTVGVVAIVTTKLLLKDWKVPPLLLTTQQLALGSLILRIVLHNRQRLFKRTSTAYLSKVECDNKENTVRENRGLQPWPWDVDSCQTNSNNNVTVDGSSLRAQLPSFSKATLIEIATPMSIITRKTLLTKLCKLLSRSTHTNETTDNPTLLSRPLSRGSLTEIANYPIPPLIMTSLSDQDCHQRNINGLGESSSTRTDATSVVTSSSSLVGEIPSHTFNPYISGVTTTNTTSNNGGETITNISASGTMTSQIYHHGQLGGSRIIKEHPVPYIEYWKHTLFVAHRNFILAGIFFSMDFLFSNAAFQMADASFVETVKASDPICTTTIALLYNVDTLGMAEGASLALLIIGVFLSTLGNTKNLQNATTVTVTGGVIAHAGRVARRVLQEQELDTRTGRNVVGDKRSLFRSLSYDDALRGSIISASTVLMANLCFAFRAMNQKRFRSKTSEKKQMDDVNLLCRMLQIGATFLFVPTLVFYGRALVSSILKASLDSIFMYITLSIINGISYATYNLASTYVLSKSTVLHHSSLNCLRRMCAIVATSIFFAVPMTLEAIMGLLTSFIGFSAFTFHRHARLQKGASLMSSSSSMASATTSHLSEDVKLQEKDSHV